MVCSTHVYPSDNSHNFINSCWLCFNDYLDLQAVCLLRCGSQCCHLFNN